MSLWATRCVHFAQCAQSCGSLFGGDIALGHAKHFEADHKFAHSGRAQQGWEKVGEVASASNQRSLAVRASPWSREAGLKGCRSGSADAEDCAQCIVVVECWQ